MRLLENEPMNLIQSLVAKYLEIEPWEEWGGVKGESSHEESQDVPLALNTERHFTKVTRPLTR